MMEEEIWKDIAGYEGLYQVSSFGNIKSFWYGNGRLLKPSPDMGGYLRFSPCKNGIKAYLSVHVLVASAFNGFIPNGIGYVVNHIDGNRSNNHSSNLEGVSHRDNISTCFRSNRDVLSSQYVGVSRDYKNNKWKAQITIDNIQRYLGIFSVEEDASDAYQTALFQYKNGEFDRYWAGVKVVAKGYSWDRSHGRWEAYTSSRTKRKIHIGYYLTEQEAANAYQNSPKLKSTQCK